MKKLLLLFALLFISKVNAQDQFIFRQGDRLTSGTITAATPCPGAACVTGYIAGMSSVFVTLSGTFTSGTLFFQTSPDGITYNTVTNAYPIGGGVPVSSATANGTWIVPVGAPNPGIWFRVTGVGGVFVGAVRVIIDATPAQFFVPGTQGAPVGLTGSVTSSATATAAAQVVCTSGTLPGGFYNVQAVVGYGATVDNADNDDFRINGVVQTVLLVTPTANAVGFPYTFTRVSLPNNTAFTINVHGTPLANAVHRCSLIWTPTF